MKRIVGANTRACPQPLLTCSIKQISTKSIGREKARPPTTRSGHEARKVAGRCRPNDRGGSLSSDCRALRLEGLAVLRDQGSIGPGLSNRTLRSRTSKNSETPPETPKAGTCRPCQSPKLKHNCPNLDHRSHPEVHRTSLDLLGP